MTRRPRRARTTWTALWAAALLSGCATPPGQLGRVLPGTTVPAPSHVAPGGAAAPLGETGVPAGAEVGADASVVRGQTPGTPAGGAFQGGAARAVDISQLPPAGNSAVRPAQYAAPPGNASPYGATPGPYAAPAGPYSAPPGGAAANPYGGAPAYGGAPGALPPGGYGPATGFMPPPPPDLGGNFLDPNPTVDGPIIPESALSPMPQVPLGVEVEETQTGRFMLGVGVNSDLGVTGQIVVDERNFDIARPPRSWDDVVNGRAFRGGGQGFRAEAMPGSQVQRYLVSLTEPYLFDTNISFSTSGYFFNRLYRDWNEERLGGRIAFGERLSPDISLSAALRAENVNINNPRILGVTELDRVVGNNTLLAARFTLAQDTRNNPFFPTAGHLLEFSYEQGFGSFSYPRGEANYQQFFTVHQRPDGSGRHILAYSLKAGISGANTPLYEHFFAGGVSSFRGFNFRGASPLDGGVQVGGNLSLLGSAEYLFPLTADDMIKGSLFVDFGTIEEKLSIHAEDYRVAPGFGLLVNVPALGPAPLALYFAVPIARENTDQIQNFSFSMGFGRN